MSILRRTHSLVILLLLSSLLEQAAGNTIFEKTNTADETKDIVNGENTDNQLKNDCFAETLSGFILYESNACITDDDCVNLCDCGATCINTRNGGCTLHYNPDVEHICPYLHTEDGKS